jgi:hypothetical protein
MKRHVTPHSSTLCPFGETGESFALCWMPLPVTDAYPAARGHPGRHSRPDPRTMPVTARPRTGRLRRTRWSRQTADRRRDDRRHVHRRIIRRQIGRRWSGFARPGTPIALRRRRRPVTRRRRDFKAAIARLSPIAREVARLFRRGGFSIGIADDNLRRQAVDHGRCHLTWSIEAELALHHRPRHVDAVLHHRHIRPAWNHDDRAALRQGRRSTQRKQKSRVDKTHKKPVSAGRNLWGSARQIGLSPPQAGS